MPHIQGASRDQVLLFPPSLDEYITDDNPARFIDSFVDQLDLHDLGFTRGVASSLGRPAYHPGDLLKLYIYGYLNRVRSSRLLEREARRNVEAIWLLKKLTPDFKTIADFRKDNLVPVQQVCRAFILLSKALDLFGGELVAVDGSKFKAVNNRKRNFTAEKLTKAAKVVLGVEELDAVADKGFYNGEQVQKCDQDDIQAYIAKPDTSRNQHKGLFTKDDFRYDKERDSYWCPQREELTFRFETEEKGRATRYYATSACGCCPIKARCTENKGGRRITRWADEQVLEKMAERLRALPEIMKQRKEMIEHVFGTMKRSMDQGYFLLRTRKKVAAEMSLTVLAYNLKRVIKVLGVLGRIAGMIERVGCLWGMVWRLIRVPQWYKWIRRTAGWGRVRAYPPTFHTV